MQANPENKSMPEQDIEAAKKRGGRKQALTEIFMLVVRANEQVEVAKSTASPESKKQIDAASALLTEAIGKALIFSNS